MAQAARHKVEALNGWDHYGESVSSLYQRLSSLRARAT
jgi:hypothetical protein